MKLIYKSTSMNIEVDGQDAKEVFESMASAQEVFLNTNCGACDSSNTRFVCRKNGKFTFYEVRCMECGCCLSFGQRSEDGALYPRRTDKEKRRLDNSGWVRWSPKDDSPF